MTSLATTRSRPAPPWAQPPSDRSTTTAFGSLSLRSVSPSAAGPTSATLNTSRPASGLRSSSRPLAVIQENWTPSGICATDSGRGVDCEPGSSSARLRATGLVTPDSHGNAAILTPPALEPKSTAATRLGQDHSCENYSSSTNDGKPSQVSPLSRLSRLWSADAVSTFATSAATSEVFSGSISLQTPFETYQSTSPTLNEVAEPAQRRARLKPKPLQLLDHETESKRARRDSYPDILHGRRDSFTFHLPSDLHLDSPTPTVSKSGLYGSAALLHSPQPRRPSLVLASEHHTLADEPYTPCWGLEPIPSLEQQAPRTAAVTVPALPFGLGTPLGPPALGAMPVYSVPPQYVSHPEARQLDGEPFRPKSASDAVSAQPGHAALVTVTAGSYVATAQSSEYPLTPSEVDCIAKLHNGRVPKLQQLAPPEHLCAASFEPIVNTGNQGPMVVQAGDWTCGVCGFIVSVVVSLPWLLV